MQRAAATNENLQTRHAPSHVATIHFINQHPYHYQKEQETPDLPLHEHKHHYCHYHHHHPANSSSSRGTMSPRATTISDNNRYLWAAMWDSTQFFLNKNLEDVTKDSPQSNATHKTANPRSPCGKLKGYSPLKITETRENLRFWDCDDLQKYEGTNYCDPLRHLTLLSPMFNRWLRDYYKISKKEIHWSMCNCNA